MLLLSLCTPHPFVIFENMVANRKQIIFMHHSTLWFPDLHGPLLHFWGWLLPHSHAIYSRWINTTLSSHHTMMILLVLLCFFNSDQITKAINREEGITMYYIDKSTSSRMHPRSMITLSVWCPQEACATCIIIYICPTSLTANWKSIPVLESLAKENHISLLCINNTHISSRLDDLFIPSKLGSTRPWLHFWSRPLIPRHQLDFC
jgi:hypothetical protein